MVDVEGRDWFEALKRWKGLLSAVVVACCCCALEVESVLCMRLKKGLLEAGSAAEGLVMLLAGGLLTASCWGERISGIDGGACSGAFEPDEKDSCGSSWLDPVGVICCGPSSSELSSSFKSSSCLCNSASCRFAASISAR